MSSKSVNRAALARRLKQERGMAMLIVPRGETDEFYEFLSITARVNGDQLVVDRRRKERRRNKDAAVGKRAAAEDRRGPIPERWERDDLIVSH